MTREEAVPVSHGYRVEDGQSFQLKDFNPADSGAVRSKQRAAAGLDKGIDRLRDLQTKLAAQRQWALLIVLQGLDAAGKDSVINHVMSGLNPQGCQVSPFRAPSGEDLARDFLWRAQRAMPERGRIGIFNRSHYEEVLVVRVHPALLAAEHLPASSRTSGVWKRRYREINAWEHYLVDNGIRVVKVFLNLSRQEQAQRFIKRIDEPEKNWKFSASDVAERGHWDEYMEAYECAIRETATEECPWYIVPADNKWFTRCVVAGVIVDALASLDLCYPEVSAETRKRLEAARQSLTNEK